MATVQWSGLVSQMKGKIRGDVLQNTQGGQVMRSNARGKPFGSTSAASVRNTIGFISSYWANLAEADRTAWQGATASYPTKDRFGNPRTPSAFNLFCRINMALHNNGYAVKNDPAVPVSLTNIDGTVIYSKATGAWAYQNGSASGADETMIVQAARQCSAGRRNPINGYQTIYISGPWVANQINGIASYYDSAFGVESVGAQIFLRFRVMNINTGQQGVPFYLSFVTT